MKKILELTDQRVKSLEKIYDAGHCPHDEAPEAVNKKLLKIIQQATYASTESP